MFAPPASSRSPARGFGRRQPFAQAAPVAANRGLAADLRLFTLTFAGGLIFMTVFLA